MFYMFTNIKYFKANSTKHYCELYIPIHTLMCKRYCWWHLCFCVCVFVCNARALDCSGTSGGFETSILAEGERMHKHRMEIANLRNFTRAHTKCTRIKVHLMHIIMLWSCMCSAIHRSHAHSISVCLCLVCCYVL